MRKEAFASISGLQTLAMAAALAAALSLAGCSVGHSRSIQVRLPQAPANLSSALVSPGSTASSMVSAPADFFGFQCFGLNVTGPGLIPDANVCSNAPSIGMGRVSDFAPAGGTLEIKVSAGPARNVQLIGAMSGAGCPSYEVLASPVGPMDFMTVWLGEKTVDVFGDVNVTIRAQYDPANVRHVFDNCGGRNGAMAPPMTGLAAWYAADDLFVAAGTPGTGGIIASWADRSPSGAIAAQAAAGYQPTFHESGAPNGHHSVHFGTATYPNYMEMGASPYANFNSPSGTYEMIAVLSFASSGSVKNIAKLQFSPYPLGLEISGSDLFGAVGVAPGPSPAGATGIAANSFPGAGYRVYTGIWRSGGGLDLYQNGVQDGSAAAILNSPLSGAAGARLAEGLNGDLAEILIYAQELPDSETRRVECQLGQKYGIAVSGCP